MQIKKKSTIESLPLNESTIDSLYPITAKEDSSFIESDRKNLADIIRLFKEEVKNSSDQFRCFIEKKAYDAFIAFADEKYKKFRNEATGIIMGYYLHDEENPSKKIVVATNFLQANGPATSTTCSISYDDYIRYDNFCIAHKMHQIIWIHSHPGYGAFYSGTDNTMLSSCFYAPHQVGVVVDNLRHEVMGFKIKESKKTNEDVYCFSKERKGRLQLFSLYEQEKKLFRSVNRNKQLKKEEDKNMAEIDITKKNLEIHHIAIVLEQRLTDLKIAIDQIPLAIDQLTKYNAEEKFYHRSRQFSWKDFFSIKHKMYFREVIFIIVAVLLSIFLVIITCLNEIQNVNP